MLRRLYISNYALIREMEVTFPGKLSVITGETGAGKSIFLEAFGLVLGERADGTVVKSENRKCIVEAEFSGVSSTADPFLEQNDLPKESPLILRRELSQEGRSRCFINDSPVSLALLKELAGKLVDIHSQHETLLLNKSGFQLSVVDSFAGTGELVAEFRQDYLKLGKLRSSLEKLKAEEAASAKEKDYYAFLAGELDKAEIKPGMQSALESEADKLENAAHIRQILSNAAETIDSSENGILMALTPIKQGLQSLSKFGESLNSLYERTNSVSIELKEILRDLVAEESKVQSDPRRLDEINARLDTLNRLLKKHGAKDDEELLKKSEEIHEKLMRADSLGTQIAQLEKEIEVINKQCLAKAKDISDKRISVLGMIREQVTKLLRELGMPNAQFDIRQSLLSEPASSGMDEVEFLFSANKGIPLEEIRRTASGGELSRLMLALKALMAGKKELPVILFDEIDSGVSGSVADKIGNILVDMGKRMQVIAITHLPQIASKGKHHLFVYKKEKKQETQSFIRELAPEERVEEIAKMLSAGKPGISAVQNAKELLAARL